VIWFQHVWPEQHNCNQFCHYGASGSLFGQLSRSFDGHPCEISAACRDPPPYNLGKEYEKRIHLDVYLRQQAQVIAECVRVLSPKGSICWQVGNYVDNGSIVPLDAVLYPIFSGLGLRMRNRIIWHFEHGLHCERRFSGRYETIIWFTKTDDYVFNLDAVRVPQKYPGKKYFKGLNAGKYSYNPLGKNHGEGSNLSCRIP